VSFFVADHYERAELEAASALDHFRRAVDENNLLHDFFAAFFKGVFVRLHRPATTATTATRAALITVFTRRLRRGHRLRHRLLRGLFAPCFVFDISHVKFSG
jgi:hypothetical protein